MLIVFTGNGKGKTTAALGQMVRVTGRGKNALMIQFIKGPWKAGEDEFATRYQIPDTRYQIKKMGLGFVGILGDTLPREEHQKAAEKALAYFKEELAANRWQLIVLDEVNNAVSLGLLKVEDVTDALRVVPEERLVVLTGRDAHPKLIEMADLVTEMREVKHPFSNGVLAKRSIEF
jgi:cob(I)alamin adenosyltransferase